MVSGGLPVQATMRLEVVQACGLLAAVNAAEQWTEGASLNMFPRVQLTPQQRAAERVAEGLLRMLQGSDALMMLICLRRDLSGNSHLRHCNQCGSVYLTLQHQTGKGSNAC